MAAINNSVAADENVEIWKIKQLMKNLEIVRGNGTSMISLHIPPKDQISRHSKMLTEEAGTASNIKKSVNRLSVLSAITSVQAKLRLYSKIPPNGLVIYCGTVVTEEGKEKKINIDFEPFKPICRSLYLCDNRFHVEALKALLTDDTKVGFIIMDGSGALFGTLQGSVRQVIHKFTVDLPNKNGRGGQSALRFARIRLEKRHNYVRKVAEIAAELFIFKDKVTVTSLILAGSADFKNVLAQSEMFDPRLKAKIVKIVDIGYGDVQGFNEAIDLSEDALRDVKFLQEKILIEKFFEEIAQDSGLFVYGPEDTLKALEMGAVQTLICWENLDDGGLKVQKINGNLTLLKNPGTGDEAAQIFPLLEFLANNYTSFGTNLEIVTDRTREGAQFVRGFGGIGGILRYKVDFQLFETTEDEDDFDLDEY